MQLKFKLFMFLTWMVLTHPIAAQVSCASYLYNRPGFDFVRDGGLIIEALSLIEKLNDNKPVRLDWAVNLPVSIKPGEIEATHINKRHGSYVFAPQGDPKSTRIGRMFPGPGESFMTHILDWYSHTFNVNVLHLVKSLNQQLDPLRSDKADIVLDPSGYYGPREILGTIQVYDASPDRVYVQYPELPPKLPVEISLDFRNLNSDSLSNKLMQLKLLNPGLRLFEIGRLTAKGNLKQTNAILKSFELFLENYYLRHFPNSYFVAHVATPIHLRLFRSRYQMTLLETINLPDGSQEYVLGISGNDFRKILQSRNSTPLVGENL